MPIRVALATALLTVGITSAGAVDGFYGLRNGELTADVVACKTVTDIMHAVRDGKYGDNCFAYRKGDKVVIPRKPDPDFTAFYHKTRPGKLVWAPSEFVTLIDPYAEGQPSSASTDSMQ